MSNDQYRRQDQSRRTSAEQNNTPRSSSYSSNRASDTRQTSGGANRTSTRSSANGSTSNRTSARSSANGNASRASARQAVEGNTGRPSARTARNTEAPSEYRRSAEYYRGAPVKKKKSYLIPILAVALVCVIGVGIFVVNVFGKPAPSGEANAGTPALVFPSFGSSFSLEGPEEVTLMINSSYIEQGTSLPAEEVSVEGAVDTSQEGSYVLTYTNGSNSITRTVNVINNKQMVMNLNGSQDTYVKQGQPYIESGCHVIDQTEGNLSPNVVISGEVDTATPGDYGIVYAVSNSQGVQCVKKRTVHVVDEGSFQAADGVAVLMYHYVYTESDLPIDDSYFGNYIKDTDLEQHLQYLTENNYYYPSFEELSAYVAGTIDLPAKSVVLTFDDGQIGFLTHGIPLMEKYKVPATSFVIASDGDAADKVKNYASEYISFQSHSYAMHQGGGGVGHGGIISAMSKDEIVQDLKTSQEIVQNTQAFAYPFGDNTETAHEAVTEAGILCAFTTEYGFVHPGDAPSHLSRIRISGDISLDGFIASIPG